MAHSKPDQSVEATSDTYLTPTYARESFGSVNDVTTMPQESMDPREVRQMIYDRIDLDFANSSDLGSYNFDYMDPEADELRQRVIGKVFIDKETYVQTAALGDAASNMVQNWYGGTPLSAQGKADNKLVSTVTIGSSEAIMLGLMAHRQNWVDQWRINFQNNPSQYMYDQPLMMYARDVHTCWDKYSLYYDVPALVFDLTNDNYLLDPDDVAKYLPMRLLDLRTASNEGDPIAERFWAVIYDTCRFEGVTGNTLNQYLADKYVNDLVCCVGTVLGTTFTGQGDPIAEIDSVVTTVNANSRTGFEVPIHVDAASGGFVVPFTDPTQAWDYSLDNVMSINVSNHKFGSTYPGCGTITFRNEDVVPKELIWKITYLGGAFTDYTVNFSRDSAGPLSAYYNIMRFGLDGFSQQNVQCTTNAKTFAEDLGNVGTIGTEPLFTVLSDNDVYPIVVWRINPNVESSVAWNLVQLADLLQENSWKLPAYRLPYTSSREPDGPYVCRVVTRPDVSAEKLSILLSDIEAAVATLNDMYPANSKSGDLKLMIEKQQSRLERTGSGDYYA